jgi:hypothetical protein
MIIPIQATIHISMIDDVGMLSEVGCQYGRSVC